MIDLRAATEDDVARARKDSYVQTDLSNAEILELFNRVLDVLTGEDEGVLVPRLSLDRPASEQGV